MNVSSGALTLHDDNDLILGTVTSDTTTIEVDGSIAQASGSSVTAGDTVITTTEEGSTVTLSEDVTITGGLDLSTENGVIAQTGGSVIVTGQTDVDSGAALVDLASVTNDFDGSVNVNSGALTLHDDNDLLLGTINSDATTIEVDGSITQATGSSVTTAGDTAIETTEEGSSITLSENVTVTGELDLTTQNGEVNQTGGSVIVSGATNVATE